MIKRFDGMKKPSLQLESLYLVSKKARLRAFYV